MFKDFRDVIDLWDTRAELARDLGTPQQNVQKMYERNSIAPLLHSSIVSAAKARRFKGVSIETLRQLYERRWAKPRMKAERREARA